MMALLQRLVSGDVIVAPPVLLGISMVQYHIDILFLDIYVAYNKYHFILFLPL